MTIRTTQSFFITLEGLKRGRPSVECFDIARVEFECFVAVRYRTFVLWRLHAHVARGTIAVEDGLRLRRHGDGARVVLSGDCELAGLVRLVALLLQRGRERLAFLFLSNGQKRKTEPGGQMAYLHPFRAPESAPPSRACLACKVIVSERGP